MSRKKSNRTLIIIFVLLLAVFAVNQLVKMSRGERSFRDDIIEFKANDISRIVFYPKGAPAQEVELYREDSLWRLKASGKEYSADQDMANGIVEELAYITPDRLVANKKDLWKDYDVTDSAGTKVVVFGPKKSKTELVLGRFSYNQATRKPSTYLRVDKDNDVFAVEGYLAMTFSRDINGLRNKTIFKGNPNDVTKITFTYPADSSFTLVKENNQWLCNGQPTDSARTSNYLTNLTYLTGNGFRDDFDSANATSPVYGIQIEGINLLPVGIKAYSDISGLVINSTENKTTHFDGMAGDLSKRIFLPQSSFMPKQ